MSKASVVGLSDRERVWLAHVRQARELKVSFAEYCRQQGLKAHQWYWIKRGLIRKGVMADERGTTRADPRGGFVPVRIAPQAASGAVCRLHHPSGWVIECASLPQVQWLSALLSGEAA